MSRTLNFFRRLLATARNLETLGLNYQACQAYRRLADMPVLPAQVAEEVQARLGELHLDQSRFVKARRHLTAALLHRPDNARYHFLLACAIRDDDRADPDRASEHFSRCLELDGDNPTYVLDYVRHLAGTGQREQSLALLHRLLGRFGDDPKVLGEVTEELHERGELEEAGSHLRLALFRHPQDARFRRLWNDHQFRVLWAQQQKTRSEERAVENEEAVVLPFVARPSSRTALPHERRVLRHDAPAHKKGPYFPTRRRLPR